jgi:predicted nucleic acid-binding protein
VAVFLDTSGIIAVLNPQDEQHRAAAAQWATLLAGDDALVTTNYVLAEAFAVLAHHLGVAAVRAFQFTIVPARAVEWVERPTRRRGRRRVADRRRARDLSLVDCVSFAIMRRLGLDVAFALDRHVAQQGFRCIP